MSEERKVGFSTDKGRKSKAESFYDSQLKAQARFQDPQRLKNNAAPTDKDRYGLETQGHFISKDAAEIARDERMRIFTSIPSGTKELGEKIMTEEVVDYVQEQKKKQQWLNFLNFAQNGLIDLDDPRTQEEAYQLVPELKSVPDRYFEELVGTQMTIRNMLRDGKLRGKADALLLYDFLQPSRKLPLQAIWDPSNVILEAFINDPQLAQMMQGMRNMSKNQPKWWWSPFTYAGNGPDIAEPANTDERYNALKVQINDRLQMHLKVLLARRLLAKYRKWIPPRGATPDTVVDQIYKDLLDMYKGTPATLDDAKPGFDLNLPDLYGGDGSKKLSWKGI